MKGYLKITGILVVVIVLVLVGVNYFDITGRVIVRTGESDVNITVLSIVDGSSLDYDSGIALDVSVVNSSGALEACWYSINGEANVSMMTPAVPAGLGSELVSNGGFDDGDDGSWTVGNNWAITDFARFSVLGGGGWLSQTISLTQGNSYNVTYTYTWDSGSQCEITPYLGGTRGELSCDGGFGGCSDGVKSEIIVAGSGSDIAIDGQGLGACTVDDVSVREVGGGSGGPVTCDAASATCDDTCNDIFNVRSAPLSGPFAYNTVGEPCGVSYTAGTCQAKDNRSEQGTPSPNYYNVLKDAECDQHLGAGTGECAEHLDGLNYDHYICPSYDRKGSTVTSANCVNATGFCGMQWDVPLDDMFNFDSEYFTGVSGGSVPSVPCTNTTIDVSEGDVDLVVYANDSLGNVGSYSTSFVVDLTGPLIELVNATAVDNANLTQDYIYVNVSVVEVNEDTVIFNLYNDSGLVNSTSFSDGTHEVNWIGLAYGNYSYNVTVNDSVGKSNFTATRGINISAVVVEEEDEEDSGSGSGDFGGVPTYTPSVSDVKEGYTVKMGVDWKIDFKSNGDSHSLKLDDIDAEAEEITVTVSSEPQTKVLSVGEEWKVNLDGDDDYDLLVRLDGMTSLRADVFTQEISELIVVEEKAEEEVPFVGVAGRRLPSASVIERNRGYITLTAVVVLVLNIIIFILNVAFVKKRKGKIGKRIRRKR